MAGPVNLTLTFCDFEDAVLFTETHTAVPLTSGVFSILIGAETTGGVPDSALTAGDELYLGLTVNADTELWTRAARHGSTCPTTSRHSTATSGTNSPPSAASPASASPERSPTTVSSSRERGRD